VHTPVRSKWINDRNGDFIVDLIVKKIRHIYLFFVKNTSLISLLSSFIYSTLYRYSTHTEKDVVDRSEQTMADRPRDLFKSAYSIIEMNLHNTFKAFRAELPGA